MMKRELRIGNLVTDEFFDSFSKIIEVDSIGEKGINLTPSDDGKPYGLASSLIDHDYSFDQLRGIPLTTEWLYRFRFSHPGFNMHCLKLVIGDEEDERLQTSLQFGFALSGYVQICRSGINAWSSKCEYVHQLQNIYFALTGEELLISN